jgi:plasmid rolling circle replication initiator protein Rep
MLAVVDYLNKGGSFKYALLTLTVENCTGAELRSTLDMMMHGINLLFQRTDVKKAVKGWYRGLEITRNADTGLFHPHVHLLLCVPKSYATSRYYISQKKWAQLWRDCCKMEYDPIVDIRFLKGDMRKGFAEVAKYAAKESDYIVPTDFDLTVDVVADLDAALHKRRLISYGGNIAEARRALKLQDEETADLIHVDDESVSEETVRQVVYFWSSGFSNYIGHYKQ